MTEQQENERIDDQIDAADLQTSDSDSSPRLPREQQQNAWRLRSSTKVVISLVLVCVLVFSVLLCFCSLGPLLDRYRAYPSFSYHLKRLGKLKEKREALERKIEILEKKAPDYEQLEGIFLLQAQSLRSSLEYLDQMVTMTLDAPVGGSGDGADHTRRCLSFWWEQSSHNIVAFLQRPLKERLDAFLRGRFGADTPCLATGSEGFWESLADGLMPVGDKAVRIIFIILCALNGGLSLAVFRLTILRQQASWLLADDLIGAVLGGIVCFLTLAFFDGFSPLEPNILRYGSSVHEGVFAMFCGAFPGPLVVRSIRMMGGWPGASNCDGTKIDKK